jgi:hypothetical protein
MYHISVGSVTGTELEGPGSAFWQETKKNITLKKDTINALFGWLILVKFIVEGLYRQI